MSNARWEWNDTDGLMQERSNSSALAIEWCISCINPLTRETKNCLQLTHKISLQLWLKKSVLMLSLSAKHQFCSFMKMWYVSSYHFKELLLLIVSTFIIKAYITLSTVWRVRHLSHFVSWNWSWVIQRSPVCLGFTELWSACPNKL